MYSSMMTPVCTDTPKSARKPMPEDTLKCVPVSRSASNPPMRRHGDHGQNQQRPLGGAKHRVENDEDDEDRQRHDDREPRLGALAALSYSPDHSKR